MSPATGAVSVADLRGPATDFPRYALLHELFADRASQHPDAPAVRHRGRELSYAELDRRSRALAARLLAVGARQGDAIGVCGSRSPEALIAFLGALRAGCAYVPMDDDLPPARVNAMAEDAGVRVAVVLPDSVCRVRRLAARVDLGTATEPSRLPEPPAADITADGCAYVMFTSGSTGRPKPVAVPHRGVVRLVASDPRLPRPGAGERVLHGYSPSSDASTIEIWSALVGGACLVIVDREELVSPEALHRRLQEEAVDVAYLTTSVFHHVARTIPKAFAGLDFVSAGGEAMDPDLARAVLRACPATEVVNFYGPTENTVVSTFHTVGGLPDKARTVPIGIPLANSTCRVLRSDGTTAENGEEGELFVGGDGLALGYLGDVRLTNERFVELADGQRFYRTGDRVVLDGEGRLEYLGRMDRQVKIRGHRIEPDEVEARLREHPDVAEAVVEVCSTHLDAHIIPADPGRGIEPAGLRGFCASWLPAAAVPRAFHTWESFPVSAAGKVDRARLAAESALGDGPVSPAPEGGVNSVRDSVVSAWRTAIGVTPKPGDDFFLIGGDSLLAAEAVNRTRAALGVGAEHGSALIRALIERPELEEFIRAVERILSDSAATPETSTDFEAEARLGLELAPRRGPAPNPSDPAEVLLTGATGFVGAYLLDRLLSQTGARVHCPVRARDAQQAQRRVLANLARYGLSTPGDQDRLVCFPADLSAERLGLAEPHAAHLADRLDLILHSGAQVNFVYPYSALRATNVEGTREIVRLSAPRRVPVHFLSTIAVLAGFGSAGVRHVTEDMPLAYADRLTMGYAESKWVAERLLGEAGRLGLPVTVYRPYEITGDRDSGICNTETAICSMFKMIAETGVAPDMELPMDFVPVDHLVDTILHVATGHSPARPVYHLTNPSPARLSDVVRRMRAAGCRIRTLPYQDWVTELVRHVAEDPTSPTAPFVSLCVDRGKGTDLSVKELYLKEVFPSLGRTNAEAAVTEAGLTCPPVDDALIDRYLDFMFDCGFIRRPSRAAEPAARGRLDTVGPRGEG
ncbi:amino acid adenylation domain-containing SDR family oxidoreductase [Nocardiopsis sp. FR6]|uniref:amino acid adenylation domain-containing SDR family oxidoreductase n=1 Tax=Nocardiopsis sp. FR6 TaxID=2605986 RepID=UPI00135A1696|nr:amino acid adenylation domain-containing SDR family oxidoreductase [Nocardiopsis sp. FR6]